MNKIKLLRIENGVKQADLAKYLNVAPNTLSQWENDKNEPDFSRLKKIADYFNTTTDYILDRTDNPKLPDKESRLAETRRDKREEYLLDKVDELKLFNPLDIDKVIDYIELSILRYKK